MKSKQLLGLGMLAALLAGSFSTAAFAEGTFSFYKQTGGVPTKMCTLSDAGTQRYNLKKPLNKPCENDEASSVILENVKSGATLRVYDNQWGHKTDGWTEITVKQSHPHYVIHSFQGNYEDEYIKEAYHNDGNWMGVHGLNDQVSRIEINEPMPTY
jgi:hypothetical protein